MPPPPMTHDEGGLDDLRAQPGRGIGRFFFFLACTSKLVPHLDGPLTNRYE